jgi:RHS repeat-associated protein
VRFGILLENFAYFENDYHSVSADLPSDLCGRLKGFRLTSWTFPQGVTVTPTYTPVTIGEDSFDTLSSVANSVGRSLSFTDTRITAGARHIDMSDNTANPLSMTDAMGHATSFTYRPPVAAPTTTQRQLPYPLLDSITTPEHPSQPNTEYDYDGVNQISTVTDAVAIQQPPRAPYTFLIADGTRGERDDPLSQPYTVVYDTYGHASRYIDELGFETDAVFDSRDRAVSYTYPEGDCEVFGYDNRNNTTNFWKVDKTSSCNTGAGSSHVLHASATWDPSWNKPLVVTNARGYQTILTYYPTGSSAGSVSLLHTATRPTITEGTPVYTFDYDAEGKLADMTGPTGIVTHNGYDGSENLTSTVVDYATGHLNLTTTFGYDTDGNVNSTTDPNTNVTSTIWDANRRRVEDDHHTGATLAAAEKTLYDAVNRVTDDQVGTAFSGTTVTTWLTAKHTTYTPTSKVTTITDADSRTTTTAYDDGDRVMTVTDPASRATRFNYCTVNLLPDCAANQVSKEIRAWSTGNACSVSGTLQECYRRVTYLPDGEEQTIRDANGNTTTYTYDGWNRLNDTAFPDTTHEHLVMDENGNVTTRTTRAGDNLIYTYNELDWMTQKVMPVPPSSSLTTSWAYLLDGRIDVITDTAGYKIDYGYDTAGRMNQVANRIDGFGADRTVNYQLDANGNRTQLQWPTQDAAYAVGYCYDSLNRMTQAMENSTTCGTETLATYAYDPQSRRTSVTYGNGASMSYPSYSLAGDLKTLAHNFTGAANDNTFTYAYTLAHQTQTVAASNASFFWQPPTNNSTSYTVNNLNQYPTIGTQTTGGTNCQGAAQGLSYDCNGNLTFDGNFTYTYDAENRLLKANNSTVNAKYEYDPLGRRTKKAVSGATPIFFLSDGTDEIAEYDNSNAVTKRYIPGPAIDEPIAMETVSGGAKEYFHTDRQGSVVAMSDGSGALTEGPYTYDPYGNCFVSLAVCSVSGEPYRFTGRRYDAETGCYYYRARYYCPDDDRGGRFLQTDTVGYTADLNLYTYAGNDPTDRQDPTGLCDDLTGCNPALARQENDPMTQRSEQVTMAVGAPVTVGIGIAIAAGPATVVGTIAISGGVGGTVSAAHSAAQGNSPARVAVDAAKGTATSSITATAGKVGGIAGGAGTVSGEMTGAYAGAKAVGGSDTEAAVSAVVSGTVGAFALPFGTSTSSEAAAITSQVIKSFVKSEVKTDGRKEISAMPAGCSKGSNGTGC